MRIHAWERNGAILTAFIHGAFTWHVINDISTQTTVTLHNSMHLLAYYFVIIALLIRQVTDSPSETSVRGRIL